MAAGKGWIVTTSGERPLGDVARDLRASGFVVDQVLDEIGCITGGASEGAVDRLRAIPGVADVSREGAIDIGPPGGDVTW